VLLTATSKKTKDNRIVIRSSLEWIWYKQIRSTW